MKGCRSRALPGSCSHLLLQLGFSLRQGWDPGMAPDEAEALRPVPGGGGSTEELQNLSPLLSTCLQRAWTRSSGLGSTSAPGAAPGPSVSLLQPQACSQPRPDLSGYIQTWKSHLQSLAGFRKQGWRGGQRAGGNRAC